MIASFGDSATADFFNGVVSSKTRRFQGIAKAALTKLSILAYARTLGDLAFPPSNNLEALKGNLKGLYSIRINKQWRIVFKWEGSYAYDVVIDDYH